MLYINLQFKLLKIWFNFSSSLKANCRQKVMKQFCIICLSSMSTWDKKWYWKEIFKSSLKMFEEKPAKTVWRWVNIMFINLVKMWTIFLQFLTLYLCLIFYASLMLNHYTYNRNISILHGKTACWTYSEYFVKTFN